MILKTNQGQLIDAIAFNIDSEIWPNANARLVHLAYKLDINHFRGKSTLQLIAQTIKVTSQR
jgi:single-stranded-DNA-specific exonuclease